MSDTSEYVNAINSALLGFAVGDALGVPVEFKSRAYLNDNPVKDMAGYGTYNKPAGTWSDDTSMTLALADSLATGKLDYYDIMQKFADWYLLAAYTPENEMFDIGNTTSDAINRFLDGVEPLSCGGASERDNGNGSLMRILPLMFYLKAHYGTVLSKEGVDIIHDVSALTHAHPRSKAACVIYCAVAEKLLEGATLTDTLYSAFAGVRACYQNEPSYLNELSHFQCMALFEKSGYSKQSIESFAALPRDAIKSSGYVVNTLDAALWCLLNHTCYKETVLAAVNLGEDTDTTAAVCGGLAGLYYGRQTNTETTTEAAVIPQKWIDTLINLSLIEGICSRFSRSLRATDDTPTKSKA